MNNQNTIFTMVLLVLGCVALPPVAQAAPPPKTEDRGNGNSAAENVQALNLGTTGSNNTAHGWFSLFSNTSGSENTADGFQALAANTTGSLNTANGFEALSSNTTGNNNTAIGHQALFSNTTGGGSTAIGNGALFSNTSGGGTAIGQDALFNNTTGEFNTATGNAALFSNTTGELNTATGILALFENTDGRLNTAVGSNALIGNTTGSENTATGSNALQLNTSGAQNTAIGSQALFHNTGSDNIALGANAGSEVTTANNVICIGHSGFNADNSCFIGNIRDALVAPDAVPVLIDSVGKLGTTIGSSRRFKTEIKPMDKASETILELKPVRFRYRSNKTNTPQFGLIAEDVAQVNPDLVVRDKNGELLTVRYEAVNAMLLNEFLKEHKKVENQQARITELTSAMVSQEATIAQQQKDFRSAIAQQEERIKALTAHLKEQAVQIQKVEAQIQIRKPSRKTVLNTQ
jgi:trimeric autotransporter adhesin